MPRRGRARLGKQKPKRGAKEKSESAATAAEIAKLGIETALESIGAGVANKLNDIIGYGGN